MSTQLKKYSKLHVYLYRPEIAAYMLTFDVRPKKKKQHTKLELNLNAKTKKSGQQVVKVSILALAY